MSIIITYYLKLHVLLVCIGTHSYLACVTKCIQMILDVHSLSKC